MSDLQSYFEASYRERHNLPNDFVFEQSAFEGRCNEYTQFEIQTAWASFIDGFNKGLEQAQNYFCQCDEVADD